MATTEAPETSAEKKNPPPPPPPKKPKRRLPVTIIIVVTSIIVIAVGFYYFLVVAPYESTDDAFIDGHSVAIAPQVAGRVARLLVTDNQDVKKGDTLVEIDRRDYETKLAQARANLAAARSRLEQARAQLTVDQARVAEERANVVSTEADATRAQADMKRYQAVESRAVSQSQIDLAIAQAQSTAAQVDVARSKEQAAEAQAGLGKVDIDTAAADVAQNEALLHQAELDLSYAQVVTPEDGRVTHRAVEAGNYVQIGQVLLAIVPRNVWITANFKETQLAHMQPGQPVTVRVDAFPQLKFKAHVDSIQAGTGAQFSLLPPENAAGNYVKVVQRVPVKIVFDEIPDSVTILPLGASVVPKVKVK
jgi:membrane fusion protein (multidrug efflux system)